MNEAEQAWRELQRHAVGASFSGISGEDSDEVAPPEVKDRKINPHAAGATQASRNGQSMMPPMMMGGAGGGGQAATAGMASRGAMPASGASTGASAAGSAAPSAASSAAPSVGVGPVTGTPMAPAGGLGAARAASSTTAHAQGTSAGPAGGVTAQPGGIAAQPGALAGQPTNPASMPGAAATSTAAPSTFQPHGVMAAEAKVDEQGSVLGLDGQPLASSSATFPSAPLQEDPLEEAAQKYESDYRYLPDSPRTSTPTSAHMSDSSYRVEPTEVDEAGSHWYAGHANMATGSSRMTQPTDLGFASVAQPQADALNEHNRARSAEAALEFEHVANELGRASGDYRTVEADNAQMAATAGDEV